MAATLPLFCNLVNHPENYPRISPLHLPEVQDVNGALVAADKTRKKMIELILGTARETDEILKHKSNTAIAGKALSIIGSVVGCVAGGIVIVATAGAATLPLAAIVLMGTGTGVGLVGGLTQGIGGYICTSKQDALLQQLRKAIEEDEEAHSRLEEVLKTFNKPKYNQLEFGVVLEAGIAVVSKIVKGGAALIKLLGAAFPKLSKYIGDKVIQDVLGSPLVALLGTFMISGTEGMSEARAGLTIVDDIALGAVGGMAEGPAKDLAFQTAKTAAAAVIKEGGDDIVGASVNLAANTAAKEAAQNVVKVMARVTGGVTIGLGALMIAWDIRGLYVECKDRNRESLGDALRRLAKSLADIGSF